MRFESLLWTLLAMFLIASVGMDGDSIAGAVGDGGGYQAADGGADIPPPTGP